VSDNRLWSQIAERLGSTRSYWIATTNQDGSPHVAPIWGALVEGRFHFYSERRSVKGQNLARDPRLTLHLESAEDVVIVYGHAEDIGDPRRHPQLIAALAAKYSSPQDAGYLPSADPAFDVSWILHPDRALMWKLADYEGTQERWHA
jgi:hypothetical protein